MKKLLFIFLFVSAFWSACAQKYFPGSYYITLKNDTVKATLVYTDIFEAQHILQVLGKDSSIQKFLPNQIKGFCIASDSADLFVWQEIESDADEVRQISPHGIYRADAEGASSSTLLVSKLFFKSILIDPQKHLFVTVRYGNREPMQYLSYYYVHTVKKKSQTNIQLSSVSLILKDNQLIDRNKEHTYAWLSRAVSDYPLLSGMVKDRKLDIAKSRLDARSINVEMILREYNAWRKKPMAQKADTSLTLKGILDADRLFKSHKAYWAAAIPASAFLLPGLIVAGVALNHPPKEKDLRFPVGCTTCKTEPYLSAYKMRAAYKRERSIQRGLWTGFFVGYCIILPILIIESPK